MPHCQGLVIVDAGSLKHFNRAEPLLMLLVTTYDRQKLVCLGKKQIISYDYQCIRKNNAFSTHCVNVT